MTVVTKEVTAKEIFLRIHFKNIVIEYQFFASFILCLLSKGNHM